MSSSKQNSSSQKRSTSYVSNPKSNTLHLIRFLLLLLTVTSLFFFTKKTLESSINLYSDSLIWSDSSTSSKVDTDHPNDGVQTSGGNHGVGTEEIKGNSEVRDEVMDVERGVGDGGIGVNEVKNFTLVSDEMDGVEAGDKNDGAGLEEVKNETLESDNVEKIETGLGNENVSVKEVRAGFRESDDAGIVKTVVVNDEVDAKEDGNGSKASDEVKDVKDAASDLGKCDLYSGSWVKDEKYPIYKPGLCPYIDEKFECQGNGRGDSGYLKWRWKPDGCELPWYNATDFLGRLRGKRLVLVGDSMNRNQFESLLCLLREGMPNKSRMYEIHGHKISKERGFYHFKFEDYNCSVEFVRSHFLVKEGIHLNAHGQSNPTLSIDRIDKHAPRWKRADILIFNTGHWWTHRKTARGKNHYKEGDFIYPEFELMEAFRRAINTWGRWIDRNIDPAKQLVFYRGYSPTHFRGGDWDLGGSCNGEEEPILSAAFVDTYPPKMKVVQEVIAKMRVPVLLLNVTKLTNFRKDGHPSAYWKNITAGRNASMRGQDCSHWCLPGVPDAWNELIYTSLIIQQTTSLMQK